MKGSVAFIESNTTGTGLRFFACAEELGMTPVLISTDPERYRFLSGFSKIKVEELTLTVLLNVLREMEGLSGIWSSSDRGILLASEAAERLRRPHADPVSIAACRDKFTTRVRLHEHGLSSIPFALLRGADDAAAFAASVRLPIVIKPTTSSGSVGVRLCGSVQESVRHAASLLDAGFEELIGEGFIDGAEYSVEIFDNKAVGVTSKNVSNGPHFIESGHDFPAPDGLASATLACFAERTVAAMGLCRGPAHVELKLGPDGPNVVEVNPRLAGGMIPELIRHTTGLDLVEVAVRFACGLPYAVAADPSGAAAIRFVVRSRQGPVARLSGLEHAESAEGVVGVGVYEAALERTGPILDFRDRLAYVMARADAVADAGRYAEAACSLIVPEYH
jgi:biotin carboxylase